MNKSRIYIFNDNYCSGEHNSKSSVEELNIR